MRFLLQFHNLLIYVLLAAAAMSAAPRPRHRRRRDPGRRAAQRGHRLRPGGPRRAGARGDPQHDRPARLPCCATGGASPIAAEEIVPGDSCCSRPATACRPTCGSIEPRNLRIDEAILTGESVAGRQGDRAGRRDAALGDRTLDGLLAARWSPPARAPASSVAHRRGHRARPDQRPARRGRDARRRRWSAQMDRFARQLTVVIARWSSAAVFAFARLRARLRRRRSLHGRGRARRRRDPGGPAGGHDHHAGDRRAAHGPAQRHHPPAAGGRDARLGLGHLLRQDRHADPQRDDGATRS